MTFSPVIPRDYGSIEDVVSRLLAECGGEKTAAFHLGRKKTQIYEWAHPRQRARMALEDARRLTAATRATACAEDFAALAGGVFTPIDCAAESLARLIARGEREHSKFISRVIERHQLAGDGRLGDKERREAMRDVDEAIRAFVAVRRKLAGDGG